MKKLLTALVMFCSMAVAQVITEPHTGIALGNANGVAVVLTNANVRVCSVPTSAQPPCSTPTALYLMNTDGTCSATTIPNPSKADASGNYGLCAATGQYVVEISTARFGTVRTPMLLSKPYDPVIVAALPQPVDVGITYNGRPASGLTLVRHKFPFKVTLEANCPLCNIFSEAAATADAVFTLYKNGVAFGTATIPAGGTLAVFASTAVEFDLSDVLKVTAPNPQDATMADLGGSMAGAR